MKPSRLKKIARIFLAGILGLILFTLLLSGGITIALVVANQHGTLQKWVASAIAPVQVTYQTAHVSWHHGAPRLALDDVSISDSEKMQEPLALQHFTVDISIWRSILKRELVTSQITISGLQLQLIQNPDGSLKLLDFDDSSTSPSMSLSPQVTRWFLNQGAIHIQNLVLSTTLRSQRQLHLHLDEVNWLNRLHYEFNLKGTVQEIPDSVLELDARLDPGENPLNLMQWRLEFNGQLQASTFTPFLGTETLSGLKWQSGGGNIRFDGQFFDENVQNVNVDVSLSNLNLGNQLTARKIAPTIDDHIIWTRTTSQGKGWKLVIYPLHELDILGSAYDSLLTIAYTPEDPQYLWQLSAKQTDFAVLGEWINFWFKPGTQTAKVWNLFDPTGRIDDFEFKMGSTMGQASFVSSQFQLGSSPIFPNGWPMSQLEIKTSWVKTAAKLPIWKVALSQLHLKNQWIDTQLSGAVNVNTAQPKNPQLTLKGTIAAQNLDQVKKYYIPKAGVSPSLNTWLNQGLVALPDVKGQFTFRGALQGFPYTDQPGLFQIALHVNHAIVSPYPGWPDIRDINADVLFHNQSLSINATQVETLNIPVTNVHFIIADLRPHAHAPIEITGESTLTGDQGLAYVAAMPLTPSGVDQFLLSSKLTGNLKALIDLYIPLEGHGVPVLVKGQVLFNQNNWFFGQKDKTPFLGQLNGPLQFQNQFISSPGLSVFALSQPLNFMVLNSPVNALKLLVQSIKVMGQSFNQVQVGLDPGNNQMTVNVNSPQIMGAVTVMGENKPITAHFNQIHFSPIGPHSAQAAPLLTQGQATVPAVPLLGQALAVLPVLTVGIDHLYYNNQDLGALHWASSPLPGGILIQQFVLSSKPIQITASGKVQTVEGQDEIHVVGHLMAKNYGAVLTELGYPNLLSQGSGPIDLDLSWLGGVHIDYQSLNGSMKFDIANGEFLQINTGFAKLFGLFSLDSIINTLSFNFKKVFGSGLSFDQMSGSYTIQGGVATTADFRMTGSALNMTMKGYIDLVNDTINQKVTAMPQIGNGIAIAAGIVGTPIAGVATWFAEKLLGNTVFRDSGIVMSVTGPLSNPKVSMSK